MPSIFELVKAAHVAEPGIIRKASRILCDRFNSVEFFYKKIKDSGELLVFESNLDVVECIEGEEFFTKYPFCCHPKHSKRGFSISRVNDEPLLDNTNETRNSLLGFGFRLGVRLIHKNRNDFVEEFGFHFKNDTTDQCCFIMEHLSELCSFSNWFLDEIKDEIKLLEENPINLIDIIGEDFVKNRTEQIGSPDPFGQKFLQDLRTPAKSDLTSIELETLQLLVEGYTPDQIGKLLYRSKKTIEHRIENIKDKLDCHSRADLVDKAHELKHFEDLLP